MVHGGRTDAAYTPPKEAGQSRSKQAEADRSRPEQIEAGQSRPKQIKIILWIINQPTYLEEVCGLLIIHIYKQIFFKILCIEPKQQWPYYFINSAQGIFSTKAK